MIGVSISISVTFVISHNMRATTRSRLRNGPHAFLYICDMSKTLAGVVNFSMRGLGGGSQSTLFAKRDFAVLRVCLKRRVFAWVFSLQSFFGCFLDVHFWSKLGLRVAFATPHAEIVFV